MKVHRFLLKGLSIICLSFFLSFFDCSTDVDVQTAEMQPLTDVCTLELTFGAEGVSDEFLLAEPYRIAVNKENDILVVDENYVKVYDSSGKENTMFGGTGQGPGEFERAMFIWISPECYISVFGGRFLTNAHFFRPDYSFINRVNYEIYRPFKAIMDSKNLIPGRPEIVFALSESERVYSINSTDKERKSRDRREIFLFYETTDSLIILANYPQTNRVPNTGLSEGFLGLLHVGLLQGNRVAYIHSFHDSEISEKVATYTITIQSLHNLEKSFINHPYIPVEIDWKPSGYEEDEKLADYFDKQKYKASLQSILTDSNYIYAVTYTKNDKEEFLMDVFDGNTGKYISSAFLPFSYGMDIMNGYAYKISDYIKTKEFPIIEKYKIDPAVYGK